MEMIAIPATTTAKKRKTSKAAERARQISLNKQVTALNEWCEILRRSCTVNKVLPEGNHFTPKHIGNIIASVRKGVEAVRQDLNLWYEDDLIYAYCHWDDSVAWGLKWIDEDEPRDIIDGDIPLDPYCS